MADAQDLRVRSQPPLIDRGASNRHFTRARWREAAHNALMLHLFLTFALAQSVDGPPPVPPPEDAPLAEPSRIPDGAGSPMLQRPEAPPDQPLRRVSLSALAGAGGGAAALGLSLAFNSCFGSCPPKFDATFANAALGGLLIAGVTFAVHQILGGGGEVTLPVLAALAIMAGASVAGSFIDPSTPNAQLISSAIGVVPASIVAGLILEATSSVGKSQAGTRW